MLEGPLIRCVLVIRTRSKTSRRVLIVVGSIDEANSGTECCLIGLEAIWSGFCTGIGAAKLVVGSWGFGRKE